MNRYRVAGGVCRLSPSTMVGLLEDQFKSRAHKLELVERIEPEEGKKGKVRIVARVCDQVEFKVGEIIRLGELDKHLATLLQPLDPPVGEADKIAAGIAASRGGNPKLPARSPDLPDPVVLIAKTSDREEVAVSQSDLIAKIFEDCGVSLAQWNSSSDQQRTMTLTEMIEIVKSEAVDRANKKAK